MKKGSCNKVALCIIIYLTMFYFGILENLKSVVFPMIKEEFDASYDEQGLLVSLSWYGYVIFCVIATIVIERCSIKADILSGYLMTVFGSILTLFIPSFSWAIFIMMVVWMGFGFFEVGANALATSIFTSSSAVLFNLMHFFYGLGAIVGPFFATWCISLIGKSYKSPYYVSIAVMGLSAIVLSFIKFNIKNEESEEQKPTKTFFECLKDYKVWWCGCTLGFMEIIEFGASNWGALYFQDLFGYNIEKEGATFVSIFYVMFTATRLISGFWIEKVGYFNSIQLSLAINIIVYVIGFLIGSYGFWVLPFTGFFIGVLFPTFMCSCIGIFKENTPIASSIVIVISGCTNGLVQYLVGVINEYIGSEWGYRCFTLYSAIPLISITLLKWHLNRLQAKEEKNTQQEDTKKNQVSIEIPKTPEEPTTVITISKDVIIVEDISDTQTPISYEENHTVTPLDSEVVVVEINGKTNQH
ncbi:hypothetical protein WA158_005635 [Blastocystis sp. Blastoise]